MERIKNNETKSIRIKNVLENKSFVTLIGISIIAVILIPFLSKYINHVITEIIWYISSIVYLGDISLKCIYSINIAEDKITDYVGKVGSYIIWYALLNIFVINYYNIGIIWHYISFAVIFIAIPIVFYCFLKVYNEVIGIEKSDDNTVVINSFNNVMLYWCFDLLYLFYIKNWIAPTLVFGLFAVCIIFYNLAKIFLRYNSKYNLFLIVDFILGVVLSIYLIYCIKDDDIQNIVLVITAAIYGGMLTLIGVAWTIKHTQMQNFESNRLEKIPYLNVDFDDNVNLHNNIVSLYLNITKNPNNDDPTLLLNMNISNIGLGIATNIKCDFESTFGYSENWLPFNILRVEKSENVIILLLAETQVTPQIQKCSFIIKFNDILGNEYEQIVNVSFKINKRHIELLECAVLEPKLVRNYIE